MHITITFVTYFRFVVRRLSSAVLRQSGCKQGCKAPTEVPILMAASMATRSTAEGRFMRALKRGRCRPAEARSRVKQKIANERVEK